VSRVHPLATAHQSLPRARPAAGLAVRAPALILPALYALAVVLLLASRVREFADESDNLLGGYLIARGERLYADYFSNHMPLPYYLAAIPSLLGASRIEHFRAFTDALLIATTLGLAWGLMYRRGLGWTLAAGWASLTVFAHTVQWGEMLHAGTCAGFGLLAAGVLFYTTPRLRFSGREQVGLAAAAFVALQSELLSIYPLGLLAACYVLRRPSPRHALRLASLVVVPHVLVLLGFAAVGALGAFVYDAYQFNQTYYARFVMNGSILGMLHDWEAQYRTYLVASLLNPLGLEGCLVLGNLLATLLTYRTRGPAVALAYFVFISLTRVRNGGPYYLASYFSLALVLAWAIGSLGGGVRGGPSRLLLGSLAALGLVAAFVFQVARTYDFSNTPAYAAPEQAVLQAITSPTERIFVAPYDPYLYLASGRLPVSTYEFYFPWQAADPRSDSQIMDELRQRRPAAVVFRQDDLVNGQYLTRDWAGHLEQLLQDERYSAVDAAVADVFVPAERLPDARARLRAAGLLPE
jgi:hypothetical protein